MPDEPIAIVATGTGAARSAVVGALLGSPGRILEVPDTSYLVVRHGARRAVTAHLPGARRPHPYPPAAAGSGSRPPRRVELVEPDPLLRHFALVDTPDTATLGVAGARIVLDAAERGGALLFVLAADQRPHPAELELLAAAARRSVAVFCVITPDARGGWRVPDAPEPIFDPATAAVEVHRAVVTGAVPALDRAPWFAVDPAATDTAYLRRALVEWAGAEGLRRASLNPPVPPGAGRTVRVAPHAHESDWSQRLETAARAATERVRQRLAVELGDVRLRIERQLDFGAGPTGLPAVLDRELHALSLRAAAEGDAAVERLIQQTLADVLAEPPDEGVRRRVVAGVRRGLAEDAAARDLARVFLVTATGGVAVVAGAEAVAGLAAYPSDLGAQVLPEIGLGLSGGCYLRWRNSDDADAEAGRAWAQRALHAVEHELLRETGRRFGALRDALAVLLAEAVDHGILLA
ncbi:hypothetical protein [Micromonospora pattaloongensis]|uniref:hypothetical protein n=1 Tax=Micromonospora pattaloongensis TaxID=405436 RepID=UPI0011153D67|nr:hypothetical protein [Micromonospora pattaloongensis]